MATSYSQNRADRGIAVLRSVYEIFYAVSYPLTSLMLLLTFNLHLPFNAAQNDNLPIHEDKQRGVYVKNLTDFYVSSKEEVYEIMRQGGQARAVTATSM